MARIARPLIRLANSFRFRVACLRAQKAMRLRLSQFAVYRMVAMGVFVDTQRLREERALMITIHPFGIAE